MLLVLRLRFRACHGRPGHGRRRPVVIGRRARRLRRASTALTGPRWTNALASHRVSSLCPICDKHRGLGPLVGPVIFADDLVAVTHRPLDQRAPVPGYLFVETIRHAPTLADLTDDEAAAVGWAARRAAAA